MESLRRQIPAKSGNCQCQTAATAGNSSEANATNCGKFIAANCRILRLLPGGGLP
jgi:hypothetical protein